MPPPIPCLVCLGCFTTPIPPFTGCPTPSCTTPNPINLRWLTKLAPCGCVGFPPPVTGTAGATVTQPDTIQFAFRPTATATYFAITGLRTCFWTAVSGSVTVTTYLSVPPCSIATGVTTYDIMWQLTYTAAVSGGPLYQLRGLEMLNAAANLENPFPVFYEECFIGQGTNIIVDDCYNWPPLSEGSGCGPPGFRKVGGGNCIIKPCVTL